MFTFHSNPCPHSIPLLLQGQTLESHDYVFWCGDLNYRVDLPTLVAKDHIANGRWGELALQDQLTKQRKMKKVWPPRVRGCGLRLSLSRCSEGTWKER